MARQRRDHFSTRQDLEELEWAGDSADQAFWDEFWSLEDRNQGDSYTIIVRNERTGEEQRIEKVRFGTKRGRLEIKNN